MKLSIYSHANKLDKHILRYYEVPNSNTSYFYLLQSPQNLVHLKGKSENIIVDYILQKYDKDKGYENIILFNEILGIDCKLHQPLTFSILKTVTDYIKRQGNYKTLLLNEFQLVSSYLQRKQVIKELLQSLELNSIGLQYHYIFNTGLIALPILKLYIDYFTSLNYQVHLTEVSIWEPNQYLQEKLLNTLYHLVKDNIKELTYWYLFDKESNITPYKSHTQLPGLCTLQTDRLIKDYPYYFTWTKNKRFDVQEFVATQDLPQDITWDSYLIKKSIWNSLLCKMKS